MISVRLLLAVRNAVPLDGDRSSPTTQRGAAALLPRTENSLHILRVFRGRRARGRSLSRAPPIPRQRSDFLRKMRAFLFSDCRSQQRASKARTPARGRGGGLQSSSSLSGSSESPRHAPAGSSTDPRGVEVGERSGVSAQTAALTIARSPIARGERQGEGAFAPHGGAPLVRAPVDPRKKKGKNKRGKALVADASNAAALSRARETFSPASLARLTRPLHSPD